MSDGREYHYQADYSFAGKMFHVRFDGWDEFQAGCKNMESILPSSEAFPNDDGPVATPPERAAEDAPLCEVHKTPMGWKAPGISKVGRPYPGFFSCGTKDPITGAWCSYKPPKEA